MNIFTYYMEYQFAHEKHPKIGPEDGSLTPAELRELVAHGAPLQMNIMGNQQSFAHFEKILSYPQYDHLGESGRLLSPAFKESYDLLRSIYSEMAPVFSSQFFNVNCDETWDLGRGASRKLVDSLGIAEVYAGHINRIYHELKKLGKRMMMWGDIALKHSEILKKVLFPINSGLLHLKLDFPNDLHF